MTSSATSSAIRRGAHAGPRRCTSLESAKASACSSAGPLALGTLTGYGVALARADRPRDASLAMPAPTPAIQSVPAVARRAHRGSRQRPRVPSIRVRDPVSAAWSRSPYSRASAREREINLLLADSVSFMYALSVGGLNQLEILRAMATAEGPTTARCLRSFRASSTRRSNFRDRLPERDPTAVDGTSDETRDHADVLSIKSTPVWRLPGGQRKSTFARQSRA